MRDRARLLAFVALAALAVRVLYVVLFTDGDAPPPASDRSFFVEAPKLLVDGRGFVHPFVASLGIEHAASAAHPPLWIFVLAPLAKLGLLTPLAARLAACLAGAVAVLLVGLIARRMAGPRAGLAAAAIAAVYPAWVITDGSGMSEALYLALVAGAVLAALRLEERGGARSAVLLGVLVGLAALTRTEGLFLVPFVIAPLLWRRWRLIGLAALAAVLTVAPWTIRNAVTLDRFIPVSTNVDSVLAGANCDETYHGRDTGLWSYDCLAAATKLDQRLTSYDEGRLAAGWRATARSYASDHAGRVPAVVAVRIARLWRLWQPLREADTIEGVGQTAGKVGALSFLLLLLPGALLGVLSRRLRREHLVLFAGLALMVSLTAAIGWGAPRFLRPAEIGLVVCASLVLTRCHRRPLRGT